LQTENHPEIQESSESDISDDESEDENPLPPPPPPIPSDYLPLEEVVRELSKKPGWLHERKLKKVVFRDTPKTSSSFPIA